ncbi:hypothetical protein [Paenibacillus donghaensis]|nr:hypothetical protein [Paenibacillus donghaensis]
MKKKLALLWVTSFLLVVVIGTPLIGPDQNEIQVPPSDIVYQALGHHGEG